MNSDLLTSMLKACSYVSGKRGDFSVSAEVSFALLIESSTGGAAPIAKVETLSLKSDFIHVVTAEANYLLPYENVVGLKWTERGDARSARTGFHA